MQPECTDVLPRQDMVAKGARKFTINDDIILNTFLIKRLSIGLWRGNACMWASHMPIQMPSEDGIE